MEQKRSNLSISEYSFDTNLVRRLVYLFVQRYDGGKGYRDDACVKTS